MLRRLTQDDCLWLIIFQGLPSSLSFGFHLFGLCVLLGVTSPLENPLRNEGSRKLMHVEDDTAFLKALLTPITQLFYVLTRIIYVLD